MKDSQLSWEQSVTWLKEQPDQAELVRNCFFDDPLILAAERYEASEEWVAIKALLPDLKGDALDLGAGRGISSFALARAGWNTVALEPNNSSIVGANAIRNLAVEASLGIEVVEEWGEHLPFHNNSFDLVHCRQVLHHANDLQQICREIDRVLKPGGTLIATREHVISRKDDLNKFLESHPLHKLYGGECAYLLQEYLNAIKQAGLVISRVINPFESNINLYPETVDGIRRRIAKKLYLPSFFIRPFMLNWMGSNSNAPGRLYTFIAYKKK